MRKQESKVESPVLKKLIITKVDFQEVRGMAPFMSKSLIKASSKASFNMLFCCTVPYACEENRHHDNYITPLMTYI